jgi:hypothetical protein
MQMKLFLSELNLGAVTASGMETRTRGQRTPGSGDAARTGTHEVVLWLLPEAGKQKVTTLTRLDAGVAPMKSTCKGTRQSTVARRSMMEW